MMSFWGIPWVIFLGWLAFHPQKQDLSMFDRLRCYAKPSFTYWDGPTGTRLSNSTYKSMLVCWPKHGVFMNGSDALAWDSRGVR
jgi:hypothetical protein